MTDSTEQNSNTEIDYNDVSDVVSMLMKQSASEPQADDETPVSTTAEDVSSDVSDSDVVSDVDTEETEPVVAKTDSEGEPNRVAAPEELQPTQELSRQPEQKPQATETDQNVADRRKFINDAQLALAMANNGQDKIISEWNSLGPDGRTKLASEDPARFVALQAQVSARVGQLQAMEGKLKEAVNEERQSVIQTEFTKLLNRVPEWKNNEVAKTEYPQVAKALKEVYGYSDQDISMLSDNRAMAVARDAWLWRQSQSAKQSLQSKKVVQMPTKTMRPGASNATSEAAVKTSQVIKQARKSGKEADIIAALKAANVQD